MLKLFQYLLGLIFILHLGTAIACSEGEAGCTLDKEDWAMAMKDLLPPSLCRADFAFVKCSDANQTQCNALAVKAVDECLAEQNTTIPALLNRAESKSWGEVIGGCTGKKLFNTIAIKVDKDASCRDLLHPVTSSSAGHSQNKVEKMISSSPKLTQLDSELRELYKQIEAETAGTDGETGARINPVGEEQLIWVNTIRDKCTSVSCLENAYSERINEIKKNWKEAF